MNAFVNCISFLQQHGLAFHGHDESNNQRNFLELLRFLAKHNEEIDNVALENAHKNHRMTALIIQKEMANVATVEIENAIVKDLGDSLFAIIVNEFHEVYFKE